MLLGLPALVCVTKNKNYFVIQCYSMRPFDLSTMAYFHTASQLLTLTWHIVLLTSLLNQHPTKLNILFWPLFLLQKKCWLMRLSSCFHAHWLQFPNQPAYNQQGVIPHNTRLKKQEILYFSPMRHFAPLSWNTKEYLIPKHTEHGLWFWFYSGVSSSRCWKQAVSTENIAR